MGRWLVHTTAMILLVTVGETHLNMAMAARNRCNLMSFAAFHCTRKVVRSGNVVEIFHNIICPFRALM